MFIFTYSAICAIFAHSICESVLQCVAVCVAIRVAMCVLFAYSRIFAYVYGQRSDVVFANLCCSVLQCVAVCCSMLQCVAVCVAIRVAMCVLFAYSRIFAHSYGQGSDVVFANLCCSVL